MNLIRYQLPASTPWSPIDRLAAFREEIDRLFDFSSTPRESGVFGGWAPSLDVYEEKDRLLVSVELPGLQKDAINLSFQDGVLTVSGERTHTREGQEGSTLRSERYFGKFQRSVSLPTAIDAANVKATYKDGVLLIELPKAEEAKPKQIQVNVS
jgi:HSP20 family protein